ncbi:dockerin type I domain-containing protein [Candidatus Bathyarchaeota archaeon]|nr:dockerin type I domain-containing protein [Candidatus Bathyarchaeota archaeon]
MNNRVISLTILTLLLLSAVEVFSARATPANSIYLKPDTLSYDTSQQGIGFKFNISAWMNLNTPCFAWQVKLFFNATWLKCNKVGYLGAGDVDSTKSEYFAGHATTPLTPSINNVAGTILHGETLSGADTAPAADKRLMWAELEITSKPGEGINFASLLNINNADTYALDPDLGTIDITAYNCSVTYVGVAGPEPPKPYLAVSPSTNIIFGPLPPSAIGQEFDLQIYVKELDAAWNCRNASFTLNYSCSTPPPNQLLNLTSYTVDPLWTSNTIVNSTAGIINVTVKNPSTTPSGNVSLIKIRFRITNQTDYPDNDEAPLILSNVILWGSSKQIPTTPPTNGKVIVKGFQNKVPGDVDGDGKVNYMDVIVIMRSFGSYKGSPSHRRWDERADVFPDGKINLRDLAIVLRNVNLNV